MGYGQHTGLGLRFKTGVQLKVHSLIARFRVGLRHLEGSRDEILIRVRVRIRVKIRAWRAPGLRHCWARWCFDFKTGLVSGPMTGLPVRVASRLKLRVILSLRHSVTLTLRLPSHSGVAVHLHLHFGLGV